MAVEPKYNSQYTGQQVESAIAKALQLDTFALVTDDTIGGTVYHILWKVAPTANNTVSGFAVHPTTGELYTITSVNGTKTVGRLLNEGNIISENDINSILGIS